MQPAFWLLLCLASTGACASRGSPLPADAVILPPEAIARLLRQCSRDEPPLGEGDWRPAPEHIAALELALPQALSARRRADHPDWSRAPQGWRRQYVGIVRQGRRFIYGSFYPRNSGGEFEAWARDWRTVPVIICDGGPSFFGVEYDVEAGRFTHVAFNGSI